MAVKWRLGFQVHIGTCYENKSVCMPASLQHKIAFLSTPSSYPERTTVVEAIETHMSWVFLTDRFAYKLKKPVTYDYLDFSTLEARGYFCEEEVNLNRRLAQNVYLGVLPLMIDAVGRLQLSGEGRVVEWLIKMRRLPSNRVLDYCIQHCNIPENSVNALADKLSHFYLHCLPEPVTADQYCDRFTKFIAEVIAEPWSTEYGMPAEVILAVSRQMTKFMQEHAELLKERTRAGRIIEGHGDLRAEHVYLEAEPLVVDCLEFSKELRTLDAAYDLSFLALECERLGMAQIGKQLFDRYRVITGDDPAPNLIHFYQTCQACSRARLALWHLKEVQYQGSPKWQQQAREWLLLAQRHAEQIPFSRDGLHELP